MTARLASQGLHTGMLVGLWPDGTIRMITVVRRSGDPFRGLLGCAARNQSVPDGLVLCRHENACVIEESTGRFVKSRMYFS
jgi:hypothetical protein